MNKILLNNGKNIESNTLNNGNFLIEKDINVFLELDELKDDISIRVLDNVRSSIKIIANNISSKVNIILGENSYLHIDSLVSDSSCIITISLAGRGSEIECISSVIVDKDSKLEFSVSHDSEDTKSLVVNNGFVLGNNKLVFDVNGIVKKNSNRSICFQDSKIITNNNQLSRILPNLYIENYDVEAEHSAYIGKFKEEDMFYLMSRGISRSDAYLLLVKSFLIGKMVLTEEEENKMIFKIDEYVRKGDKYYES